MPQYKLQAKGPWPNAFPAWIIDAESLYGAKQIYMAKERILLPTVEMQQWCVEGAVCPECQAFIDAHDIRQYCQSCSGKDRQ